MKTSNNKLAANPMRSKPPQVQRRAGPRSVHAAQRQPGAGLRGLTLLQDFILREKITHFGHECIPKCIVHMHGSAAHGCFKASVAVRGHARRAVSGRRQAHAGVHAPVERRWRTGLHRHGARLPRIAGEGQV